MERSIEKFRQYLLLRTQILQKTVVGWPCSIRILSTEMTVRMRCPLRKKGLISKETAVFCRWGSGKIEAVLLSESRESLMKGKRSKVSL